MAFMCAVYLIFIRSHTDSQPRKKPPAPSVPYSRQLSGYRFDRKHRIYETRTGGIVRKQMEALTAAVTWKDADWSKFGIELALTIK